MAAKSQIRLTANVNYPRSKKLDGDAKPGTAPRLSATTRGSTMTVGEDVTKARADWLVEKGYAVKLNAKGEPVSDGAETVGYGQDASVKLATREGSEQHEKPATEIPPTGTVEGAPTEDDESDAPTKKAAKHRK